MIAFGKCEQSEATFTIPLCPYFGGRLESESKVNYSHFLSDPRKTWWVKVFFTWESLLWCLFACLLSESASEVSQFSHNGSNMWSVVGRGILTVKFLLRYPFAYHLSDSASEAINFLYIGSDLCKTW